jgi:large subunit ribosomal protein L9
MDIILLENVEGLGNRGATVKVADGYARNYLIPSRLAVAAAGRGQSLFQEAERQRKVRDTKRRREAEELAGRLGKVQLTISMEAGEEDKLFGSVTSADVAEKLAAEGFEIDKRKVLLEEPIKTLGVYPVPVKLWQDVQGTVKVWVVKA